MADLFLSARMNVDSQPWSSNGTGVRLGTRNAITSNAKKLPAAEI